MKILLEVPDNKAMSLLDVLSQIPSVKARPLTGAKARLMEELSEAAEEMQQVRSGKVKTRTLTDFLNGL